MESEASWAMLALALALVLALTAVVVRLSVTEARAVRPAPAVRRPGRVTLRPGPRHDEGPE
jgi:flagellar biogenesis protein FliO